MLPFQERKKNRRILYSKTMIFVLFVLAILIARGTWQVYTKEQNQACQEISLSIFTDMSNNGFSLRETLAAIYISGVSHAVSVLNDEQ